MRVVVKANRLLVFNLVHLGVDLLCGEAMHEFDGLAVCGNILLRRLGLADVYLSDYERLGFLMEHATHHRNIKIIQVLP